MRLGRAPEAVDRLRHVVRRLPRVRVESGRARVEVAHRDPDLEQDRADRVDRVPRCATGVGWVSGWSGDRRGKDSPLGVSKSMQIEPPPVTWPPPPWKKGRKRGYTTRKKGAVRGKLSPKRISIRMLRGKGSRQRGLQAQQYHRRAPGSPVYPLVFAVLDERQRLVKARDRQLDDPAKHVAVRPLGVKVEPAVDRSLLLLLGDHRPQLLGD